MELSQNYPKEAQNLLSMSLEKTVFEMPQRDGEIGRTKSWKQLFRHREKKGKARGVYENFYNSSISSISLLEQEVEDEFHFIRYNENHMSRPPAEWDSSTAQFTEGPASRCCDACIRYPMTAERICKVIETPLQAQQGSASEILDFARINAATSASDALTKSALRALSDRNTQVGGQLGKVGMEESYSPDTISGSVFSESSGGPGDLTPTSSDISIKCEDQAEEKPGTVARKHVGPY